MHIHNRADRALFFKKVFKNADFIYIIRKLLEKSALSALFLLRMVGFFNNIFEFMVIIILLGEEGPQE